MNDYLDRPEETEKLKQIAASLGIVRTTSWRQFIEWLADGDDDLFKAMWTFENFAHSLDDMMDETGFDDTMKEGLMAKVHDSIREAIFSSETTEQGELGKILHDTSDKLTHEKAVLARKAFADFFDEIGTSQFVVRNAAEIFTMFVQAMTRCLDGDLMAKSGRQDRRILAPAVRCGDVDVLFHLVYLARGWAALRQCSRVREYDIKESD